MQGQKVVKKTFIIAFKTLLCISLFIVVGALSYKATIYLNGGNKRNTSTRNSSTEPIITARADEIAQNLILGVDEDTAEVQSIVLEIFNTNTKNIDLITIPADTKVSLSQELYAKLLEANGQVPQIITLSDIGKYFDQSVAYEYEVLILNEFLNTDISFYTALLTEDFDNYFTKETTGDKAYTFKSDKIEKWKTYTKAEEYLDELMDYYKKAQSNLKLSERKAYDSYYLNANYNYIHTYVLKVKDEVGNSVISDEHKDLIQDILSNDSTYTSHNQDKTETEAEETMATTCRIQILNATGISGLAARYQGVLENSGYTISHIGNYTGEKHEDTRIIVKEDGLGNDLASYFKSPVIETGIIDGEYDILIVLGTKDA